MRVDTREDVVNRRVISDGQGDAGTGKNNRSFNNSVKTAFETVFFF